MILKDLRKKVFITGYKGGMAHLASCFSCIDMIYVQRGYFNMIIMILNGMNATDLS